MTMLGDNIYQMYVGEKVNKYVSKSLKAVPYESSKFISTINSETIKWLDQFKSINQGNIT
jgi:hypothetical protein